MNFLNLIIKKAHKYGLKFCLIYKLYKNQNCITAIELTGGTV